MKTFPWKSYFVMLSLWTDPKYLAYRLRRLFRRVSHAGAPQLVNAAAKPAGPAHAHGQRGVSVAHSAESDLSALEVDLVYMWVHGQDPAHREKRNHWLREYGLDPVVSNPDVRYVEVEELRYSLRTVELFLPWVRRVFIVTDDQTPEWLDLSHPKVKIVDHSEVISEPSWRPTFNSAAISSQLHNIPGLAEHFIICNDDTFFGQPCEIGDFFARLPDAAAGTVGMKVMLSESDDDWIIPMHQVTQGPLAKLWMSSWNNVKASLELRRPWRKVRRVDIHQVVPMTKSAMRRAVREFPDDHKRTCANKFRSLDNVSFTALARYLCLDDATAVRAGLPSKVFRHEEDLAAYSRHDLPTLFCVNGGASGEDAPAERELQRLFPEASAFELGAANAASA